MKRFADYNIPLIALLVIILGTFVVATVVLLA